MFSTGLTAVLVIFTVIHIKFVAAKSNAERPEVVHDVVQGVRPNANRYNPSMYKKGTAYSVFALILVCLACLHDVSVGSFIVESIGHPAGVALNVYTLEQFATSIVAPGTILIFHTKARAHLKDLLSN